MRTPTLRRAAWIGAGLAAVAGLAALALTGGRPETGRARFEAAGVMRAIAVDQVTAVEVAAGDARWRFRRAAGGWAASGAPLPPGDLGARVETALRYLHASAPQRTLTGDDVEATPPAEFGLDPPRCVVTVEAPGRPAFSVAFGGTNAQGLAQYARASSSPDLLLLPRFVGEAWDVATGLP